MHTCASTQASIPKTHRHIGTHTPHTLMQAHMLIFMHPCVHKHLKTHNCTQRNAHSFLHTRTHTHLYTQVKPRKAHAPAPPHLLPAQTSLPTAASLGPPILRLQVCVYVCLIERHMCMCVCMLTGTHTRAHTTGVLCLKVTLDSEHTYVLCQVDAPFNLFAVFKFVCCATDNQRD